MPDTKRYTKSLNFYNDIIKNKYLNELDIHSKEREYKVFSANEEFKYEISKTYIEGILGSILEIRVKHNNGDYLRTQKLTKAEFRKRLDGISCWIYSVEQNRQFIGSALIKNKYNKERVEFITDDFWFKDFKTSKWYAY